MAYQSHTTSKGFEPINTLDPAQRASDKLYSQLERGEEYRKQNELSRIQSEKDNSIWKSLGAFSEKATQFAVKKKEEKDKKDFAEGLNLAFTEGFSKDAVIDFENTEKQIKDADTSIHKTASEYQKKGYSQEVVDRIKAMSPMKGYGYAQGLAQRAGAGYGMWLDEQLSNNDTLQIDLTAQGGRVVTPKTAQTNSEKAAVINELRKQYFAETGLAELNPILVNKYAFNDIRKYDGKIMAATRKQNRIEASLLEQTEINQQFDNDLISAEEDVQKNSLNNALLKLGTTVDDRDNKLGMSGAIDHVITHLKAKADAGELTDEMIDNLLSQKPTHAGGKTYGELTNFRTKLEEVRTYNYKAKVERNNARRKEKEEEGKQIEENFAEAVKEKGDGVFTDAELQWYADEYNSKTGNSGMPKFLEDYHTVEDEVRADEQEELERLRSRRGYLLKSDLVGLSYQTRNLYLDRVKEDKPLAEASLKGVTTETDALIKSFVSSATGIAMGDKSKSSPDFNRIYMRASADFEKVFMDKVRRGETIADAQEFAIAHVRDKLQVPAAGEKINAKTQLKDIPYNAPFEKKDRGSQAWHISIARDQIKADVRVLDTEVLVGSDEYLEELKNNIDNGNETIPSYYKVISDSFPNLTDWELADMQLKASGHPGLNPNPVVEELNNLPELKRYFYYRLTPNRVQQNIGKTEDINSPQEISYFNRNQDVLLPGLSIA